MNTITISEILKGLTPGTMQSVGYMQMIPLLTDDVDKSFDPPDNIETNTSNYGVVNLNNKSANMTIFPSCAGILTKQSAQNHGIAKATFLMPNKIRTVNEAACIQSSQGGTIRTGVHQMTIMPWALREAALISKDLGRDQRNNSYGKLWPAIGELNAELGLSKTGHLELYLKQFKTQLDEFIGQFERLPNQVGAIILMNGNIMGFERSPNYEYWKTIWSPLIRESYGSLILQYIKKFGADPPPPKTRAPLKSTGINSIGDIRKALKQASVIEEKIVKQIIRSFIKEKFTHTVEETNKANKISVEHVKHRQMTGQIVRREEKVVYASLITTGAWIDNPGGKEWKDIEAFKI
jgi:hypothetical protein